ncbi:MAG: MFS transporter [Hyphomicrobiales bacterium]|nr:MAG: MFS transporter [Hyphomicrobiales bacterium]
MRSASRRSERGLDWFAFFVADIQTGFGPFLSVYLTTQKWTQTDIGLILAMGSLAGLLSQIPGGWIVDIAASKRNAAMLAVCGVGASALLIALLPTFLGLASATLLHVAASAILGPAMAAITLGLVGAVALGPRLGRNARYAALGNGIAAALMGFCGYVISPQSVFYVTALLTLPTLIALATIRDDEVDPVRADGGIAHSSKGEAGANVAALLVRPALWILAGCVFLFHAANAAMLPLIGSEMTVRSGTWASVLVAACIVVPQFVVTVLAPHVGRLAQSKGRQPVLMFGFAALPLRAVVLALSTDPIVIVAVQVLDGLCAAVLGVLVPLSLADIARGSGRFNLAQGIVASATGIGAAASTAVTGYLATTFGTSVAFIGLMVAAVVALLAVTLVMPETRPAKVHSS